MREWAEEVCQDDTLLAVSVDVPLDRFDDFCKAVEKEDRHNMPGGTREQQDFFTQQNPATRKMSKLVEETYEAMILSLAEEVSKVFRGE